MSVEVRNLKKTYRRLAGKPNALARLRAYLRRDYNLIKALDDVSFNINPGEKVTILGPNGAGKSTIIKILTGIIHTDAGEAQVDGLDPQSDRYKAAYRFGVVFGHRSLLWKHIPVIESFRLYRDIYDLDSRTFQSRLDEFIDVLQIKPFLNRQPRRLSLGERMRCELVASLIHNPPVVFLDEPTIGLDIVAARRIREFINERNRNDGTTVVLCSHNVRDIEQICTRAILLLKGQIRYDGPTKTLATVLKREKLLRFTFRTEEKPISDFIKYLKELSAIARVINHSGDPIDSLNGLDNSITIEFNTKALDLDDLVPNLVSRVDRIIDIQIADADLEDIIEELYKDRELPV
ncbi:MAG: ATP-binding cassette domain-containing protein [Candidatus Heimdallarchaeota archaeon]